jgi:hypothetical protein
MYAIINVPEKNEKLINTKNEMVAIVDQYKKLHNTEYMHGILLINEVIKALLEAYYNNNTIHV